MSVLTDAGAVLPQDAGIGHANAKYALAPHPLKSVLTDAGAVLPQMRASGMLTQNMPSPRIR